MFTKFRSAPLIDKVTWLGAAVLCFIILIANQFIHNSQIEKLASVQKLHCAEKRETQLELVSRINDDFLRTARTMSEQLRRNLNIELDNPSIKGIIHLKSRKDGTLALNKRLQGLDLDRSRDSRFDLISLLPWLQENIKNTWLIHPEYYYNKNWDALFVLVPSADAPGPNNDLFLFEVNSEILKKPFGHSDSCPLSIWNSSGQAIIQQFDETPLSTLSKNQNSKGQSWVEGKRGNDLVVYEQHPTRLILAQKISFQNIYEQQNRGLKNTLFLIGLSLFSWSLISLYLLKSFSGPIERFIEVLQRVARGDFNVTPRLFLRGEMGRLERAISEMTHRLRTQFGEQQGQALRLVEDIFEGTEEKKVAVLACRIQNPFGSLKERTYQQTIESLNKCYDLIEKKVSAHGGTVYNLKSDSIYAVWPTKGKKEGLSKAVMCAIEIRRALGSFNEKRIAMKQPPIYLRMGLDTSNAFVGLVGPGRARVRRVISESEETAEQLSIESEKLNLDFTVSESVSKTVEKYFPFEPVSSINTSAEPINVFKVGGYIDNQFQIIEVKTDYSE